MRRKDSERGQSLVELSLALVFLLVLLSGIVDLGRIFFTFVALRDAAQEGAAYAAISPFDTAGIENRVRGSSSLPVNLGDTTHVLVTVTPMAGNCLGQAIQVQVTYNQFPLIMPFSGTFIGSQTITLNAVQTDTILRSTC